MKRLAACVLGWLTLASAAPPSPVALDLIAGDTLPAKLSDYRFFLDAKATQPNARVGPYRLTTELFSDYADKHRFMFVPDGLRASVRRDGDGLHFPVGSALIKHFGYGDRLIETRVMLKRATGWVALPYVWENGEAVLKRGGKRLPVSFAHQGGTRSISYAVPNQNQCKGCHASGDELFPIGPRLSTLQVGDQYARLSAAGLTPMVRELPAAMPRWDDPASGSVDVRSRAYLDINCAHCHSRDGPASNSGLYLGWRETDMTALGLYKRPVAAGRGSGGHDFAIEPGAPERSILLYRMQITDPGVAMPELGRATVHEEAVALLREWIAGMKPQASR